MKLCLFFKEQHAGLLIIFALALELPPLLQGFRGLGRSKIIVIIVTVISIMIPVDVVAIVTIMWVEFLRACTIAAPCLSSILLVSLWWVRACHIIITNGFQEITFPRFSVLASFIEQPD